MKRILYPLVFWCVAALAAAGADLLPGSTLARMPARPPPPACSLQPVGVAGHYLGFDLVVAGQVLAPVRFSSNQLIDAAKLEILPGGALRFTRLQGAAASGLELAADDFVLVAPGQTTPYPEVSFQLSVKRFNAEQWNAAAGGPCPFHFLTLYLEGAEAIHHRGWLVATPTLDPYPLQGGRQGIVASKWSRDWTWAPPFGACPIPVAGLWAPQTRRYVAWDFTNARFNDHTEAAVASAYCWKQGQDRNFVTLVYPFAQHYVVLRQPDGGETIASHGQLIYDLDLPSWEDPNQRYHERLWRTYYDLLPGAPAQNDLNFLPGYAKLQAFRRPAPLRFTYTVPKKDEWESMFFEEGTVVPGFPEIWPLDYYYWKHDQGQIADAKGQLQALLLRCQQFPVVGEPCCYWPKPLAGKSKPALGDVTTLRNVHGWAIAEALLCVYAHEKDASLLPAIDGALNWTKYNICTRNDISDVPEAMFTMGWPGVDFCLRYYQTFRDDPARAVRAQQAYRLALSLAYRYTTLWLPDTAVDDNVEGTFLVEPNSGQPWTGAACANECNMMINAFAKLYAATGDPIILAYLRGMLERWSLLYQAVDADDIWDYSAPFAECLGIYDGCQVGGRNKRSTYGGQVEPFDLVQPVGSAQVRVVAGEKGAAAFNKRGMHTDIADFRSSKHLAHGLSFRVTSSLPGAFDLILTTPQFLLAGKRILCKRGEVLTEAVAEVPEQSPWDVIIHGVRHGDVIAVGALDLSLPLIDCRPIKSWGLEPRPFSAEGFRALSLAKACNWAPKLDWEDASSYAPYFPDYHYAFGVPYFLVPAYLNAGKAAVVDASVQVDAAARALAVLVSEVSPAARLAVHYDDGQSENVPVAERAVAWKAWPMWFKQQIDIVPHPCRAARIRSVEVTGAKLWGITLALTEAAAGKVGHLLDVPREERRQHELAERLQAQWQQTLTQGHALRLEVDCTEPGYAFCYVCIAKGAWQIPKNAFLEYDLTIPFESIHSTGGIDLTGGTLGSLREAGIGIHPSQLNDPRGVWHHHKDSLDALAGKTFEQVVIATDGSNWPRGRYKGCFKNIRLTDGAGRDLVRLYADGAALPLAQAELAQNGSIKGMARWAVQVIPAASALGIAPARALEMKAGVAKDDFSTYPAGSDGSPTWQVTDGAWLVKDGLFVGSNCNPLGWIATGANAGDKHWKDYRLSLRFKLLERGSDWRDGAWIGFHNTAGARWKYSLNLQARNIVLHKANRGAASNDHNPLAEVPWQPDAAWHQVVISVTGKHLAVELDGRKIMDVQDDDYLGAPPLASGGITLCARRHGSATGNTTVAFADVELRELP